MSLMATATHTAKVLPKSSDVQQLTVEGAVCTTKPRSVVLRGRRKVLVTLKEERCDQNTSADDIMMLLTSTNTFISIC